MRAISHAVTASLGFLSLAADCLRGLASVFARPRTVDAIVSKHVRDVCSGPEWIDAVPPWVAAVRADLDAESADRNARNDWRA